MLWLLILIAVVANAGVVYLLLLDVKGNKKLYPAWEEKSLPTHALIYMIVMVIVSIFMTVFLNNFYTDNTWLFNLKRVLLLILLWPIAYIDFFTYRIPNRFILFGLLARVAVWITELIVSGGTIWRTVLTEVLTSVILLVVALVCTLIIKNGIGAGDMKLFVVMGLFLGVDGIWGAIFMSLLVSFVVSVVLLVGKKKTRKDSIPFGPAIMIGTYLSVFLTGM